MCSAGLAKDEEMPRHRLQQHSRPEITQRPPNPKENEGPAAKQGAPRNVPGQTHHVACLRRCRDLGLDAHLQNVSRRE